MTPGTRVLPPPPLSPEKRPPPKWGRGTRTPNAPVQIKLREPVFAWRLRVPRWIPLGWSIALVVATSCSAFPASAAERVMLGYYANFGKLPVEEVPWGGLTHVCHAFLQIDAEGKVVTTDAMPNPAMTADGRKNGVGVLVTIGGGVSAAGLERATATKETRRELLRGVLHVVADGKYDGVDLDWEFPRDAATRDAHARLVVDLRRALDELARRTERETPYLLTAAVSPQAFFGQWIDAERIAPAVDWLHVMAYDLSGPWSRVAAHHAPLFPSPDDPERAWRSLSAAMRYWSDERGVPKAKLVVGAPLFGRAAPADKPHAPLDPDLADKHRALAFSAVRQRVGQGWLAEWDATSRAPWLRQPPPDESSNASPLSPIEAEGDPLLLISYDDRNSIHQKATWARDEGYRGMFFWALHQDRMPDGRHWLIEAANKAWPKGGDEE